MNKTIVYFTIFIVIALGAFYVVMNNALFMEDIFPVSMVKTAETNINKNKVITDQAKKTAEPLSLNMVSGVLTKLNTDSITIKTETGEGNFTLAPNADIFYLKDGQPTKGDRSYLTINKKINAQRNITKNIIISVLVE